MKILIILTFLQNSCFKKGCHDLIIQERVIHPPVEEDCYTCHEGTGKHSFEKIEDVNSICFACHEEKEKAEHPPVTEDCTNCHNPHSTPVDHLLKERTPFLCFKCHENFLQLPTTHKPVQEGKCNSCHDVHGINQKNRFLKEKGNNLCYSCHKDIKSEMSKYTYKHEPVEDCKNCHIPHSSYFPFLLKSAYPNGIYNFYAPLQYNLCFECHDEENIMGEESNFKKGSKNLHTVHVRDREKVCTICHNPHYSKNPVLIEGIKHFGPLKYELRIKFDKKQKGGICYPACHGKAEY